MTKICIYGAGAIGGYMAACLDRAGAEVSLIARGPHLAAIREKGLRLIKDGRQSEHRLRATDNPAKIGGAGLHYSGTKGTWHPPYY